MLPPHARRTIVLDVDEVLIDSFAVWLREYNMAAGDNLQLDQIRSWNLAQYVKTGWEKRVYELRRPGMYLLAKPIPGAIQGVRELVAQGHFIVAATNDTQPFVKVKRATLARYFPSLRHIVIAKNKLAALPRADIRIDDGLHNGPTIVFPQPWNADAALLDSQVRVAGWEDIPWRLACC